MKSPSFYPIQKPIRYRNKDLDSLTKTSYNIINCMLGAMNSSGNFTFRNTWGYLDKKTNKINGMMGDILYNNTDIGGNNDNIRRIITVGYGSYVIGTSCFITDERIGVYEFITMLTPTKTKFIFRAPTLSFVTNIYYLPFQAHVWISLVALVIISCSVIYYTYRVSNMRSHSLEVLRPSDMLLFGISSICQMGTHREPKYFSGKVATVFMLFDATFFHRFVHTLKRHFQIFFVFGLIFVYTSYTANIVSLLQSTTKSIRTLEDLYHSDLGFGVEDTPYNKNYFQISRPGTIQRKIYEKKIVPPNKESKFMNMSYGVSLMRNVSGCCVFVVFSFD